MFIEDQSRSDISDAMEEYQNEKLIKKLTISKKIIRSRKPSSTNTNEEASGCNVGIKN